MEREARPTVVNMNIWPDIFTFTYHPSTSTQEAEVYQTRDLLGARVLQASVYQRPGRNAVDSAWQDNVRFHIPCHHERLAPKL